MQQQQAAAKAAAQHYEESVEFFGMLRADEWDEEVAIDGVRWWGLVRDEAGMLQVHAEFVWDEGKDSGTGWYL